MKGNAVLAALQREAEAAAAAEAAEVAADAIKCISEEYTNEVDINIRYNCF